MVESLATLGLWLRSCMGGIAKSAPGLSHALPSLWGHDNWLVAIEELRAWMALREEEAYGAAQGVPKHAEPADESTNKEATHIDACAIELSVCCLYGGNEAILRGGA